MGEGGGEKSFFTSLPFSLPFFPFSPETPDTQATTKTAIRLSSRLLCSFVYFVYFFLHLFILQAIYIVLQELKMKMLFVELNITLQE